MRFAFLVLWPLLLALAGCTSGGGVTGMASAKQVAAEIGPRSEVIYTPAGWPRALPADLYQPTGPGPWPGVVLFYGGSWSSADHRWHMRLLARKLAARGYVVLIPVYRGTPDFRYPAAVEDAREAVRWLRTHAAECRMNPQAVAAYGFSAGGHLAEMVGALDGPPEGRVQAVVAASAPADLTLFPGGEILPRFLGATFEEKPELFRAASPITYISADDPPFFLYHGTGDKTVSPEHTRVFKAALDRAGVRSEVRWVEGRGHAAMLILNGEAEAAAIAFLDQVLQ